MAVYFKFKSAKDYDSISIEGHFISVGNLKEKIVEKKNLGRGSDFDLVISNAQTNEEYTDEGILVPKNTSVLVRRVPGRPRMPIITEVRDERGTAEDPKEQFQSVKNEFEISDLSQIKQPEDSDWADEFGMDLYTMPEDPQMHPLINKSDEDNKIKAFVDASASDWQRQTQEGFPSGRGFGRGSQGRGSGGRGFGRGFEKKTPPQGYVCHRCGVPGHYIQHCPTNGDPAYDIKKVKPPTGIPKSMLVANPDGSYALPSGGVAVLRPNEAVFEREIEGLPSNKSIGEIPPELRCPLCGGVLKDAVLTSKCCFKSYCDKCIRDQIISKGKCVCGATNILADDLLPNKTLRDAINRLLETTATSSAENAGSRHQVQDMESARCPRPKAGSPSPSVSLKEINVTLPPSDGSNAKELVADRKPLPQQSQQSLEKNLGQKKFDSFEHTPESMSMREPISQEEVLGVQSAPQIEEEVQQVTVGEPVKKKKVKSKRRPPHGVNEIHWRGAHQEFPGDGGLLPYGGNPGLYNTYWPGPQWPGDGFVQPYGGNTPYGYGGSYGGAGPCEMPYAGAMIAHEPFGCPPAFMPPVASFQRDCMDYGTGSFNPTSGIMSRQEFEAKKAELRRKRELEQRVNNREQAKDLGSGDMGPAKMKRKSSSACSPARRGREPSPDMHDEVERHSVGKVGGSLSPPRSVGRRWVDRRDETPARENQSSSSGKFDRQKMDAESQILHQGDEASGRLEKRPKASVFSRISFPERPGRVVREKLHDSIDFKGDGGIPGLGVKNRIGGRTDRPGTDKRSCISLESVEGSKHGPSQVRDSGKLMNGKRINCDEEWVRSGKKGINGKIHAEDDVSDDDVDEQNFKRRHSYSNSVVEVHERGFDHPKQSAHKSVRINRERVGLSKACN